MKDAEILKAITDMILPLIESPSFSPYLKPYNIIKSIERRTNLQDEGIVVDETKVEAIQKKQEAMKAEEAETKPKGKEK